MSVTVSVEEFVSLLSERSEARHAAEAWRDLAVYYGKLLFGGDNLDLEPLPWKALSAASEQEHSHGQS